MSELLPLWFLLSCVATQWLVNQRLAQLQASQTSAANNASAGSTQGD